MEKFTLDNPVKLHFGRGVVNDLGKTIKQYGSRVLLVYGSGSIKKNCVYDDVVAQLRQSGCEWWEYTGIKPNPVVEDVEAAAELGRRNAVDVILAVGGGSVIDSAKIIGITIPVNHPAWDFYEGLAVPKASVPLISVLTLAATGTEMNPFAVVQNRQTMQKLGYSHRHTYPRHSFLDPAYTLSVPADYTAYGIADLIAHAFEAYFGDGDASLSDRLVFAIVSEALEYGPMMMNDLQNVDLREKIMYAATLALNGWTLLGRKRGDWGVHSIGHTLSMLYDTPHGASLSITYPAWMKLQKNRIPEKLALLFDNIFSSPDIDNGIFRLEEFFSGLGCPVRLQQAGIDVSRKAEILALMKKNKVARFYHMLDDDDYDLILDRMFQ
jgi:hypothetical protein